MRFPLRDFTDQFISNSYQDVLQQYSTESIFYVLDGYGNVVLSFPSSSIGSGIITNDITSSMSVATASYSVTSSYSPMIASGTGREIQYNNSGTLGADSTFIYNENIKTLYVGSISTILDGNVTRSSEYISSIYLSSGRTLSISRSGSYISSITDGNKIWSFSRTDGYISSWNVNTV